MKPPADPFTPDVSPAPLPTPLAELYNAPPPHDLEAERLLLSSMWLCGDELVEFAKMRAGLWRGAFYLGAHRVIFDGMCALVDAGKPLESGLLFDELKPTGVFDEAGGIKGVGEIITCHYTSVQGKHYANIVAEHARRRDGMTLALALATRLNNITGNSRQILREALDKLHRLMVEGRSLDIFSMGDILSEYITAKDQKQEAHLKCGVPSLDDFPGIFGLGKYTIVAGRPSMGKSTGVRWLLREFNRYKIVTGLIAVEEDRHKIAGNYISAETSIENERIAYGTWGEVEYNAAYAVRDSMSGLPWCCIDSAYNLDDIAAAFEMMVLQKQCQVVAIDHLHLIQPAKRERDYESRERELSKMSETIKNLAKKHGVCCITAAQLKRPENVRIPPPPAMTDLRGSGGIEEHADAVIMLHRIDYYRRSEPDYQPDGLCQWLIPKNRNGKTGEVTLKAELKYQRYAEFIPDGVCG